MSKFTVKTSRLIGPMGISIGEITEAESSPVPPFANIVPTAKQKKAQEIKEMVANLRLEPKERHKMMMRRKWRDRRDRYFASLNPVDIED
jgi:hypothetical protein